MIRVKVSSYLEQYPILRNAQGKRSKSGARWTTVERPAVDRGCGALGPLPLFGNMFNFVRRLQFGRDNRSRFPITSGAYGVWSSTISHTRDERITSGSGMRSAPSTRCTSEGIIYYIYI